MRPTLAAAVLAAAVTSLMFAACREDTRVAPATPGPMNSEVLLGEPENHGGTGGSGDAGMTLVRDAGVIRPSRGPHMVNVDGGAAGMNAGGRVQAVPPP